MNPNEYYKNNPEQKWKILCYRFIGRHRRLNRWEEMRKNGIKCPDVIVEKERQLVQEAYEQMRDACLKDSEYMAGWEEGKIN